jgi:general secretion pathway protein H
MRMRQDGFTLMEVIAVLFVLAVIAGLASARFAAGRHSDMLQVTAYELASRCRAARATAIRGGSQETLLIDIASRSVTGGKGLRPLSIPATITIRTETSASEQRSQSVAGIRFLPNGSSSGGVLRLESGQRGYEIRVNWFTGRVTVERTS